jgi:hypothetical protein
MASLRDIVASKTTNLVVPPKIDDRFPPADGKEAPISQMAESYLPGLRTVVRDLHLKVLIVGCLPGNLGPKWWNHPKIELWTSQDESHWRRSPIPKDVGAVLLLSWLGHGASQRIMREAKERELLYTGLLGTGDVRQLLDLAFKGYEAPAKAKESEIWDVRGDLKKRFDAQLAEKRLKEIGSGEVSLEAKATAIIEGQTLPQPSVPAPPPPPPPSPEAPPTPAPVEPSPEPAGKRVIQNRGLVRLMVQLGADPSVKPQSKEAKRLMPELVAVFPGVRHEVVMASLSAMRRDKKMGRRTLTPPVPVRKPGAPLAVTFQPDGQGVVVPAPEMPVLPAPVAVQGTSAPAADVSIDAALNALAQAETALHTATNALLTARHQMAETIVAEVELGIREALKGVMARFGK